MVYFYYFSWFKLFFNYVLVVILFQIFLFLENTQNCWADSNLSLHLMFPHLIFIVFLHCQSCSLKSVQIFCLAVIILVYLRHLLILSPFKSHFVVLVCPYLTVLPFCFIFLRLTGLISHRLLLPTESTIMFSEMFPLILQLNQVQGFAYPRNLPR